MRNQLGKIENDKISRIIKEELRDYLVEDKMETESSHFIQGLQLEVAVESGEQVIENMESIGLIKNGSTGYFPDDFSPSNDIRVHVKGNICTIDSQICLSDTDDEEVVRSECREAKAYLERAKEHLLEQTGMLDSTVNKKLRDF